MSEAMITRRGGGGGSGSNLQSKTISISAVPTNVTPDTGYDGMSSVTVNIAAGSRKAAETFTPGTQAQTIAANKWLTGAQTIRGDANLVASNIRKGVSIFNVAGSYEAAGLDTNSAVLKVVTSTGCSVITVTNGTDTFTQQTGQGFVRPNDANVTEYFFVIPSAAFGTFSVTATHPTYGDNTKANAVTIGNAGRVYEVLCGGKNILLNPTLGAQDGLDFTTERGTKRYDADYKCYFFETENTSFTVNTQPYNTEIYDNVVLKGILYNYTIRTNPVVRLQLVDKDGNGISVTQYYPESSGDNMEISIPIERKEKIPHHVRIDSIGSGSGRAASLRLNEFYFE